MAGTGQPQHPGMLRNAHRSSAGERAIESRQQPRRGALVDVEVRHFVGDGWDDLNRRGTGADDGDALTGQVGVVVPLRRVEHFAVEIVDAGMPGSDGSPSAPKAPITTSAVIVPFDVDSSHRVVLLLPGGAR